MQLYTVPNDVEHVSISEKLRIFLQVGHTRRHNDTECTANGFVARREERIRHKRKQDAGQIKKASQRVWDQQMMTSCDGQWKKPS